MSDVYAFTSIEWQFARSEDFSLRQFYAILAAREAVFVVEQACPYQELDGLDFDAWHLVGWMDGQVAAYLRVLLPGVRFSEPSIGRVLVARPFRGAGLGRKAMARAVDVIGATYSGQGIRISAQTYLEHFYVGFGFQTVSEPYLEDDIPHIEMLRPAFVRA